MNDANAHLWRDEFPKTIRVKEDMGGPFARYLVVVLELHEDGTVRWREPSEKERGNKDKSYG